MPSSISEALADGLRDAIVVVVGGRGGIGREVVRQARELGARVIVVSSSEGALQLDAASFEHRGEATLDAFICYIMIGCCR